MKKVAINIEWRKPASKLEKHCFGITQAKNNAIIDVFLNEKMDAYQSVNTFFHEMTHVFFRCYRSKRKLNHKTEERIASAIGDVVSRILGVI